MCEAWKVLGIAKMADMNIHGSARLVRFRIVDEEGLEFVVQQSDKTIGAIVEFRLLDVGRQDLCPMAHVVVVGGHGRKGGANGLVKRGFWESKGRDLRARGEKSCRVGESAGAAEKRRQRVLLRRVFAEQKKQAFHATHPGTRLY